MRWAWFFVTLLCVVCCVVLFLLGWLRAWLASLSCHSAMLLSLPASEPPPFVVLPLHACSPLHHHHYPLSHAFSLHSHHGTSCARFCLESWLQVEGNNCWLGLNEAIAILVLVKRSDTNNLALPTHTSTMASSAATVSGSCYKTTLFVATLPH